MPAKNLYIRDADKPVWNEAEASAKDSLSSLITDLLRQYLNQQKRKQGSLTNMERIEFEVEDKETGNISKKAFQGKWVIPMSADFQPKGWGYRAATAVTAKGQIFVGRYDRYGSHFDNYDVFDSIESAESAEIPADLLTSVAEALGEDFVEELDI